MKKCYLILIICALIIISLLFFRDNKKKDDKNIMNQKSIESSQDIEVKNEDDEDDEEGIETIEHDGYTILLKGCARPENNEISVENAFDIGIEEYKKQYNKNEKDYKIEMYFLDGILSKTGLWSGHIILNEKEKYEFLVDGKDGNLEYLIKN